MIFNEVGEGTLNSILVRRLSMKVPTAAPSVAPEIFPNLTLENDRPEWGFLKGEYHYARYYSSPAVAAQQSWSFLRNPAGSNMIVVCKSFMTTANGIMYVGNQTPTTLSSSLSGTARDTRQPLTSQSFVGVGANAAVPAGFTDILRVIINVRVDVDVVLSPGWWLLFVNSTVNSAHTGDFVWTERTAVPGELG